MKKILVPTDFSTCASNAVQVAMEIARKAKASIHFLHFTAIPIDWVNLEHNQEKMYPDVTKRVKECQEELNALVRQAREQDIDARTYIGYNESYANIIEYVENHEIDLVIMGSHGAKGLKEFFLGSNAQKVIRLCDAPVLVVKQTTPHFDAEEMVVVSDFLGDLDEKLDDKAQVSFARLLKLAELLELKINLLYVNTPLNFISTKVMRERMEDYKYIDADRVDKMEIVDSESLEQGLAYYLEENPNALFAMMTHGYSGVTRMMNGSLVETVANHVEAPLMSVRIG